MAAGAVAAVKSNRSWTLSQRVLAVVVLPVAVALALILTASWNLEDIRQRDRIELYLAEQQSRAIELLNIAVDDVQDHMRFVSRIDLVRNGLIDTQERYRYLPALFRSIRVSRFDSDAGRVELLDFLGRPILSNEAEGGSALGEVGDAAMLEAGKEIFSLDQRGLFFATPVRIYDNVEGSVALSVPPGQTRNLLRAWDDLNSAISLVDRSGRTLCGNATWRAHSQQPTLSAIVAKRVDLPDLPGLSLHTAVLENTKVAGHHASTTRLLTIGGAALLVIVTAVFVAAAMTARPVTRFARQLRQSVSAAGVTRRFPEDDGPRELRELARAFNAVMSSLTHANLRFAELLQNLPQGIVLADVKSRRLVFVNRAAERMFGYRQGAMLDLGIENLHPPEELRKIAEEFGQMTEAKAMLSRNVKAQRSDGTVFRVDINGVNVEFDGRNCVVGVFTDITDRLAMDKERIARRAAESANLAKARFLTNMSHEIRSPLSAIMNLSHVIRRGGDQEKLGDWADKIETSAVHLLSIINDILDLSKIDEGRLELTDHVFDLADLGDQLRQLVEPQAEAKGLSLTIDFPPLPHHLKGDQTRLRQALLNLAINAIKYTDRGRVEIRSEVLELRAGSAKLLFEVIDTGIGISAADQARLYQPFEQVASAGRGGTGLGLVITQRLARLMGGDSGVDSEPGRGSRFWITAVLGTTDAQPRSARDQQKNAFELLGRGHPGARLLVVDDDDLLREMTVELFDGSGLVVDSAGDGSEAVDLVANGHYQLVLMDMQMPRVDGLEATRRIRRLPGCEDLPIIALTGNAFADTRRECLEAGMNDFAAKPLDPQRLFATVLRWLDHEHDGNAEQDRNGAISRSGEVG